MRAFPDGSLPPDPSLFVWHTKPRRLHVLRAMPFSTERARRCARSGASRPETTGPHTALQAVYACETSDNRLFCNKKNKQFICHVQVCPKGSVTACDAASLSFGRVLARIIGRKLCMENRTVWADMRGKVHTRKKCGPESMIADAGRAGDYRFWARRDRGRICRFPVSGKTYVESVGCRVMFLCPGCGRRMGAGKTENAGGTFLRRFVAMESRNEGAYLRRSERSAFSVSCFFWNISRT